MCARARVFCRAVRLIPIRGTRCRVLLRVRFSRQALPSCSCRHMRAFSQAGRDCWFFDVLAELRYWRLLWWKRRVDELHCPTDHEGVHGPLFRGPRPPMPPRVAIGAAATFSMAVQLV